MDPQFFHLRFMVKDIGMERKGDKEKVLGRKLQRSAGGKGEGSGFGGGKRTAFSYFQYNTRHVPLFATRPATIQWFPDSVTLLFLYYRRSR